MADNHRGFRHWFDMICLAVSTAESETVRFLEVPNT